jgi:D-glycero-D-manno-heptose 1,7-bisphosphate phosphatase
VIEWFAPEAKRAEPACGTFVDRDGVINEHIPNGYVLRPEQFRFLPGAIDALRRLTEGGHALVVITNQSCVNRGLLDLATLNSIMAEMVRRLGEAGAPCAGWVCCPHRQDEGCACRKPRTAMLERAAGITGIALENSAFIGDSRSDIEAAESARMNGILIRRNDSRGLSEAVDRILAGAL